MTKFTERLAANEDPEFAGTYVRYCELKDVIARLRRRQDALAQHFPHLRRRYRPPTPRHTDEVKPSPGGGGARRLQQGARMPTSASMASLALSMSVGSLQSLESADYDSIHGTPLAAGRPPPAVGDLEAQPLTESTSLLSVRSPAVRYVVELDDAAPPEASPEAAEAALRAERRAFVEAFRRQLDVTNKAWLDKLAQLTRRVGVALQRKRIGDLDSRVSLYKETVRLSDYAFLNREGYRKVVKKFVKQLGLEEAEGELDDATRREQSEMLDALECREFWKDSTDAWQLRRQLELSGGRIALVESLLDTEKLQLTWKPLRILLSAAVGLGCAWLGSGGFERRCLFVLFTCLCMWILSAAEYFAVALLVPVLVVVLDVLPDATGDAPLPKADAAQLVLSQLFTHVSCLILGGYTVSAVFSRCGVERAVVAWLLRRLRGRPRLFVLSVMLVGLLLSGLVSNHAAPVLCLSVLKPIYKAYPSGHAFPRALLLALAMACNLGGMLTPISSMQNALAVATLDANGTPVGFAAWMLAALPLCLAGVLLAWGLVLLLLRPPPGDVRTLDGGRDGAAPPPAPRVPPRTAAVALACCAAVMALWSTFAYTRGVFGDLGVVSLLFCAAMYGSGFLSRRDFDSVEWSTLFLLGGGNVLGLAVRESRLLTNLTAAVVEELPVGHAWLALSVVCVFSLAVATLVSHSVAAVVLTPLLVQVGHVLGMPKLLVVCATLSISSAAAFPISSFPNVVVAGVVDSHRRGYLSPRDYLAVGLPISVLSVCLICTLVRGTFQLL